MDLLFMIGLGSDRRRGDRKKGLHIQAKLALLLVALMVAWPLVLTTLTVAAAIGVAAGVGVAGLAGARMAKKYPQQAKKIAHVSAAGLALVGMGLIMKGGNSSRNETSVPDHDRDVSQSVAPGIEKTPVQKQVEDATAQRTPQDGGDGVMTVAPDGASVDGKQALSREAAVEAGKGHEPVDVFNTMMVQLRDRESFLGYYVRMNSGNSALSGGVAFSAPGAAWNNALYMGIPAGAQAGRRYPFYACYEKDADGFLFQGSMVRRPASDEERGGGFLFYPGNTIKQFDLSSQAGCKRLVAKETKRSYGEVARIW